MTFVQFDDKFVMFIILMVALKSNDFMIMVTKVMFIWLLCPYGTYCIVNIISTVNT